MWRALVFVSVVSIGLIACGPASETGAPEGGEAAGKSGQPAQIAGTYEMEGLTVEKETGSRRKISGTVVVSQEGSTYSASFHLSTTYPTPDGPLPADVIGNGTGEIDGSRLEGTAETQLVMATVPGVDTKFAFVPRWVGPRLVSTARGALDPDGSLTLETENEGAAGEIYKPTRTTLTGTRIPEDARPPQPRD